MSREIKFRLWDTKHESFVNEPYHAISLLGSIQIEGHTSVEPKRYIVQQFTGLKDVHGTDIYEDYIVKNVVYRFNGVVFFDRGSFWVRERLSNVDEGLYDDREKETRWSIDLEWEIIGNIWENPELLKAGD